MMATLAIGGRTFRIHAAQRDGEWVAWAVRTDTGDRFGIDYAGPSQADVLERASRWLAWQHEHAASLEALQAAEREYHRLIASSAFRSPTEGALVTELQRESLERLEAASKLLAHTRARQPS